MPTVDEEFLGAAMTFIDTPGQGDKPFFVWFNTTRMHVFTHLKPESLGKTGKGIHADGMVEHDGHGRPAARAARRPRHHRQHDRPLHDRQRRRDRALAGRRHDDVPRREGHDLGGRLPHPDDGALAGRDQARHRLQRHHLARSTGSPRCARQRASRTSRRRWPPGSRRGGKTFKVHLDGYDFLPYFQGKAAAGPRDSIYYFDQGGNLNAIRWNDWKLSFAVAATATSPRECGRHPPGR